MGQARERSASRKIKVADQCNERIGFLVPKGRPVITQQFTAGGYEGEEIPVP